MKNKYQIKADKEKLARIQSGELTRIADRAIASARATQAEAASVASEQAKSCDYRLFEVRAEEGQVGTSGNGKGEMRERQAQRVLDHEFARGDDRDAIAAGL